MRGDENFGLPVTKRGLPAPVRTELPAPPSVALIVARERLCADGALVMAAVRCGYCAFSSDYGGGRSSHGLWLNLERLLGATPGNLELLRPEFVPMASSRSESTVIATTLRSEVFSSKAQRPA